MNYHNITKDDMLNGEGLRTVLWVAGCSHRCKECQNPVTWDINGGLPFDKAAKEELFHELEKEHISGITLSGGDPLHPGNVDSIRELVNEINEKFPNKNIWLYTGFLWEDIKNLDFIDKIDVIVDGPFIIDQINVQLHWRGSSNQRVIDVKKTLANDNVVLYTND